MNRTIPSMNSYTILYANEQSKTIKRFSVSAYKLADATKEFKRIKPEIKEKMIKRIIILH